MSIITFYHEHYWEIIFAAVFAIISLVILYVLEKTYKIFSKSIRKIINEINKIKGKWTVFSKHPKIVTNDILECAIKKHKCLIGLSGKGFHYCDISNQYHLWREFKNALNLYQESFFVPLLNYASSKINVDDIDIVLFLNKPTNILFAQIFGANCFRRTSFQALNYDENKVEGIINRSITYESGESLDKKNVVLIEALHLFPETLIRTIEEIHKLGGNLKKIIILFNGFYERPSFDWIGVKKRHVLILNDANLKMSTAYDCKCKHILANKIINTLIALAPQM